MTSQSEQAASENTSQKAMIREFKPMDQEAMYNVWYDGILEWLWLDARKAWRDTKLIAGLGVSLALTAAVSSQGIKLPGVEWLAERLGLEKLGAWLQTAVAVPLAAAVYGAAAHFRYYATQYRFRNWFERSDMRDIKKNWEDAKDRVYFVACHPGTGEVVGGTGLRWEQLPEGEKHDPALHMRTLHKGEAELIRMTVSSKHRRLGIASALLKAAENKARSVGIDRVMLVTGSDPAAKCYMRGGYIKRSSEDLVYEKSLLLPVKLCNSTPGMPQAYAQPL